MGSKGLKDPTTTALPVPSKPWREQDVGEKIASVLAGLVTVALCASPVVIVGWLIFSAIWPDSDPAPAADSSDEEIHSSEPETPSPSGTSNLSESESSSPTGEAGDSGAAEESAEPSDAPAEQSSSSATEETSSPSGSPDGTPSSSDVPADEPPAPTGDAAAETPASSETAAADEPSDAPPQEPTEDSGATTAVVVRAVDGDTLELASGQRVRVHGIDTPERGECHYQTATQRMAELVVGREVTLTRDGDDADHYGRLLRYVDVGGTDAGRMLIEEGLAIARYDSRDGYGWHSRQSQYVAADAATPERTCNTEPAQEPTVQETAPPDPAPESEPATDCLAGYSPCIPPPPPDLDCADVEGPLTVTGDDPHRLDGDGDGRACEWG